MSEQVGTQAQGQRQVGRPGRENAVGLESLCERQRASTPVRVTADLQPWWGYMHAIEGIGGCRCRRPRRRFEFARIACERHLPTHSTSQREDRFAGCVNSAVLRGACLSVVYQSVIELSVRHSRWECRGEEQAQGGRAGGGVEEACECESEATVTDPNAPRRV